FTISQAGALCSYTTGTASPAGGQLLNTGVSGATVAITATQTGCAAPVVASFANWITNVSVTFAGTTGTVTYSAAANASGAIRKGNIQIGDTVFVVSEAGASCSYTLNSYSANYNLLGGAGNVLSSPTPS